MIDINQQVIEFVHSSHRCYGVPPYLSAVAVVFLRLNATTPKSNAGKTKRIIIYDVNSSFEWRDSGCMRELDFTGTNLWFASNFARGGYKVALRIR